MELDRNTDTQLRKNLEVVWKRIEPYTRGRKLTRNPQKLQDYRVGITDAYNKLLRYYHSVYANSNSADKQLIDSKATWALEKVKRAYFYLIITFRWEYTDALMQSW